MASLYILIPIAILFVALAIAVFFWAVKSGQFDDLDTEAKRILFDEGAVEKKSVKGKTNPKGSNVVETASLAEEHKLTEQDGSALDNKEP